MAYISDDDINRIVSLLGGINKKLCEISLALDEPVPVEGDTNYFITDLVQTGIRIHDAAGYNTTINNMGSTTYNINTGGAFLINNQDIPNSDFSSLEINPQRIFLFSDNGTEQTALGLDAGFNMGNSAGKYFLGDGAFNPTPPLNDAFADFGVGINSANGQLYRITKPALVADGFISANLNFIADRIHSGAGFSLTLNNFLDFSIQATDTISFTAPKYNFNNIPIFNNDGLAGAGGLVSGDLYRTAGGDVRVKT